MRTQAIIAALLIATSIAATQVLVQNKLPLPDPNFQGKIGATDREP
jgi:hypothetical protein